MKHGFYTATALALMAATPAFSLGLDRSNQDIGIIFEQGGFAELSYGSVRPTLNGRDIRGAASGDTGRDYSTLGFGVKMDFTPQISAALIYDQPFGVDIAFGGNPAASIYGGTKATLSSDAVTLVGRYRLNENFSVHGGLRQETLEADVTLRGEGYGPLNGYNVALENGSGTGWLAGVAYERPDIALRVALTYNSEIEHEFDSTERVGTAPVGVGKTTVVAPEAWNLDFQTGIMADTLLFGSIRHAAYADTLLTPPFFGSRTGNASITTIESGTSWSLGVGRRFTPEFAGQIAIGYEAEQKRDLVSPLAPYSGMTTISVGGSYTYDNVILSGGIRYGILGDADTGRTDATGAQVLGAEFRDNEILAVGMSIGFRF